MSLGQRLSKVLIISKSTSLLSNIVLTSLWFGSALMRVDLFCRSTSPFALAHKGIALLCLIPSNKMKTKAMLSP